VFGTNTMPIIKLSSTDRSHREAMSTFTGHNRLINMKLHRMSAPFFVENSTPSCMTQPQIRLSADENGRFTNLFRGKANCNSCHLDGRSTAPTPASGTAPSGEDYWSCGRHETGVHLLRLG